MARRGRQRGWIAASVLALACLLVPAATAAQAAEVKVRDATGKTVSVDLAPLLTNPDVRDRPYTIRGASGTTTTEPLTGVSLAAVLKAAKADDFELVELSDGAGQVVEIEGADATRADWSPAGPPVFVVDAQGVRFLRDSTSEADLNEADQLRAAIGLSVDLRATSEPRVSATASPARPKVGEKVTLTAKVGGVGDDYELSWMIEGRTRSGETITHTFREKGTFPVLVTLVLPDGKNISDVLRLKVGAEKEEPKAEKDPEDEPGTVASGSTGGSGAGTGSATGSGTGSGTGTGEGGGTGSAAPSASTPAPATAESPEPAPKPERKREPREDATPAAPATIPGEVTGELLVADTAPAADPPRRSIVRAPEADDAPGGGRALGLPPAAWTGIGVGVALAAGFALDRRRLRIA